MATINVCSRLSPTETKRFQVNVKDLEQSVNNVCDEINKYLTTESEKYDILYAGQVLKSDDVLSKVPLTNLSTVYVVKSFTKAKPEQKEGTPVTPSKHELTLALQSALMSSEYRKVVERMLSDPESVEKLISTSPGLDKDPSVMALLQEPELIAVLAHPQNIDILFKEHPSFAQSALTVAKAVNEELAKSGKGATGGVSYSMDQMSDEDEDMPQQMLARARGAQQRGGAGASITASQLQSALMAALGGGSLGGASLGGAGGSGAPPPAPAGTQTNRPPAGPVASGSGSNISSDFFQQAMAHAASASSDAALQQLRDMGITDEGVARQALAATGGDIQAALDLIFENM